MKCEDILNKISEYIDKELDPSLCEEIEKHVEDCEPCVAFIRTIKKTVELFNKAGEAAPEIPNAVSANLRDYLKENIDEN